ncbi:MAG: GAF domain-containing protein [Planctomycetota bacterium]|nr:MAG: GAF domain-containing protein [Planctomycetota bacterium]
MSEPQTAVGGSFETSRYLMDSAARLSIKNQVLERLLCLFSGPVREERLHNDILDIAMTAVPCEASSVLRQDKKGNLTLVAARGRVAEKVIGLKLKKGQGIAGACAQDGRTLPVSDVASDPRHAAAITKALGFETRSLLAVPVVHQDRVLGVIELVNKTGSNLFHRHEIELVERVGRTAGDLLARSMEKKG